MCQSKKELRLIRGATVVCFLFGILGVGLSILSSSRSILFDGMVSFIQSGFILLSGVILKMLYRGETEDYPFGYSAFEPFLIIIRVTIMMSFNVFLLYGSVKSLFAGGYQIKADLALVYAAISVVVCFVIFMILKANAKASNSSLLKAEAINWLNDTLQGVAMLISIVIMLVLRNSKYAYLSAYADPVISILLISCLVPTLVRQLIYNTRELLNAAPSDKIQNNLKKIIQIAVGTYGFKDFTLYCTKTGRVITAIVYITLKQERPIMELDLIRGKIIESMKDYWEFSDIDIIFSLDPKWMDLNGPPQFDIVEPDEDDTILA
jgi:cation diffusion facilitator family transporter